jgi:endonuclease/exonuclease/phosphatase family metal-dependent hydrolase
MKKLSLIDKIIFLFNALIAALLIISLVSTYIAPTSISLIALMSIATPTLHFLNMVFLLYWLIKLKKQFLLSAVILTIGFQQVSSLYQLKEKKILLSEDVKLMTYNVRMFNLYNWIDSADTNKKLTDFIKRKNPDILCVQEYHPSGDIASFYPYNYIKLKTKDNHFGQAIFSKYKILRAGSLNFSQTTNNAIYADIIKEKDTVRIYNLHLQSLKIETKEESFNTENSEKLSLQIQDAFKQQVEQVHQILQHQEKIKHKSIICGDFNNTAFSWAYSKLKSGKNDAFTMAGHGFGRTVDFTFPFRIDFILADDAIGIHNFKTFQVKYSDHYPIMARLKF